MEKPFVDIAAAAAASGIVHRVSVAAAAVVRRMNRSQMQAQVH
jgi:hypothetical protein